MKASQGYFKELREKAIAGDVDAKFAMGYYCKKEGKRLAEANSSEAGKWYGEAEKWWLDAAREDAKSMQSLGDMYRDGAVGIPVNFPEAEKWYIRGAEKGLEGAQNNLGILYHRGKEGVPANPKLAEKYWTDAANQGSKNAMYNLGMLNHSGAKGADSANDVQPDREKAAVWYQRAAEKGHVGARAVLEEGAKATSSVSSFSEKPAEISDTPPLPRAETKQTKASQYGYAESHPYAEPLLGPERFIKSNSARAANSR